MKWSQCLCNFIAWVRMKTTCMKTTLYRILIQNCFDTSRFDTNCYQIEWSVQSNCKGQGAIFALNFFRLSPRMQTLKVLLTPQEIKQICVGVRFNHVFSSPSFQPFRLFILLRRSKYDSFHIFQFEQCSNSNKYPIHTVEHCVTQVRNYCPERPCCIFALQVMNK